MPEIGKLVPTRPVANSQPAIKITAEISTTLVTLTHAGAISAPILRWMRRVRNSQNTIQATPRRARSIVSTLKSTGMNGNSGRYPAPITLKPCGTGTDCESPTHWFAPRKNSMPASVTMNAGTPT